MSTSMGRSAVFLLTLTAVSIWSGQHVRPAAVAADSSSSPAPNEPHAALMPAHEGEPPAPVPSDATGCAPNTRCISVTEAGQPDPAGTLVAQCRGKFADFIVSKATIPAGYAGPWFTPRLIEEAKSGIPSGTRPWRKIDPRQDDQRLAYTLALRNYAFASDEVRKLTPALTADGDYFDPIGGTVPANQRTQKWYPAPRMLYRPPTPPNEQPNPNQSGVREVAFGMTTERRVPPKELADNTVGFANYAVAYYDARGSRTYARVWSTATAGIDTPKRGQMRIAEGGFVFKLLYSAAKPTDFPQDPLDGSLGLDIRPRAGAAIHVRLLQIDIAVKDKRAGTTGWYFATYAFDRTLPGSSPWLKMVPVGLMSGNDPGGLPLKESWINPAAPAYAKAHLGVDGRLNGPVDNPKSACMSCHGTAQALALAPILPPDDGACKPLAANWFRNLAGTTPFGRFDDGNPPGPTCETSLNSITLTAADYSLQLGSTVSRALTASQPSFNPCTWDTAHPPSPPTGPALTAGARAAAPTPRVFAVTRDPDQ